METISGIASVWQLLGQAITIIQMIQEARAKVRGASDYLDGQQSQLDTLLSALRLVQDEPELQTRPIEKQVQKIINRGMEMQRQLDAFAAQLTRSRARRYTRTIISGGKDEKELQHAFARLDREKADLNLLIVTTHVGLSGSMRDGFTAALAVVQRVDRNVQMVLGERLSIAAYLEDRRLDGDANNTVPLTAEDINALNCVNKVSWNSNEAFDDAIVFNSDLVERQIYAPTEREYTSNKAHGRSTVVNGRSDAESVVAILQAKRR